jgi:Tfp pilus assembly protein PilP
MCLAIITVMFLMITGCSGSKPAPTPTNDEAPVEVTEEVPVIDESPVEVVVVQDKPITGIYTRRTNRDPFAIPGVAVGIDIPTPNFGGEETTTTEIVKKPGTTGPIYVSPEDIGVSVSGIMQTGGKYRAIITSKSGRDYMVSAGEEVGEWTVAQINADSVMLKAKNFYSKLVLDTTVGSPGKTDKGKQEDTGPKVPKLPSEN